MIKDPIRSVDRSFCSALKAAKRMLPEANEIFLIFSLSDSPFLVLSDRRSEIWGIKMNRNYQFFWDGTTNGSDNYRSYKECSKEQLIEWLKESCPDHFDWLLFHPEWFQ